MDLAELTRIALTACLIDMGIVVVLYAFWAFMQEGGKE